MSFSSFFTRLLVRSGIAQVLPGIHRWSEGSQDFLHYYSDQVLQAPREALRDASVLIHSLPPDTIDLSVGTPKADRFSSSMSAVEPRRDAWPPQWGLLELRQQIAQQLATTQGTTLDAENEVLITTGAAGALHTVLDTFTNPGNRVVVFDPTSPLFPVSLHARSLRIQWLSSWSEEGRLRFHLDQLAKTLKKATLLILPPIGNPTGGMLSTEDLEQIVWWANRYDVLMYADESFANYHYDGVRVLPSAFERASKRLLTAGSVSKSHGLSSLRVGWLTGHQHLIRPCKLTTSLRASFVPTVCQQLAHQALKQGDPVLETVRREFQSRRQFTFERLQAMGLEPIWPASGLFFWIPTQKFASSGRVFSERLLSEQKVQVTRGDLFGPSGESFVRLSFAGDEGRLREGLRRLEQFLNQEVTTPTITSVAA